MPKMRFACAILPFLLTGTAALAQDVSDEELLRLFEAQRAAFRAAEDGNLGATRGLTLVTVDDVATPPAVQPEVASTGTAATGDTAPGVSVTGENAPSTSVAGTLTPPAGETAPAAGETAPTPVVFGKLAPEMQVNVHITFDFDSAALKPDQAPKLAQLCTVMRESDINLFRIVGHTDSAGSDDYNERLSMLRAQEVARHLVENCQIAPDRLEAIGLGKRFPLNEADPRSGENRRVEFQALS